MAFEVLWDPKSLKTLDKLPKEDSRRVVKKVDGAKDDPTRYAERLVGEEGYKIRVGDYRVFVDIYYAAGIIKVRAIRHRREAYKKK
ncbi:type II toxin-antitoxin system RelE/ParE family toxin [Candidatus Woesearchaeota archaeon]|nr:type II toxin-antitoxin system RelE/ParE family toxin [Candidatus Woesearchaeota archaeon]